MGDVVHFQPRLRTDRDASMTESLPKESHGDTDNERDGQRAAAAQRAAELRKIDDAITAVKTFDQADDAQSAARNLETMLVEAREKHNISKAEIAREVWRKDASNPSKRLDKVTLPGTDEDDDKLRKRLERLQKRPTNYAKVAEALANRAPGSSREAALVRVFRNTAVDRELKRIVTGHVARDADPASCWYNLAEMFEALAQAVSRRNDLPTHFKRISQTPGRYNLAAQAIVPAHVDIMSGGDRLLHYGPLANDFAVWEHYPPVPSVPLFEELLAGPFSQTLQLNNSESGHISTIHVQVQVWREMRLAVGPVDAIERAGALFEVRTRVDLVEDDGVEVSLPRPWFFLDAPEHASIMLDGQEFTTTIDLRSHNPDGKSWRDLLAWKALGFDASDLQPEHNYAAWRPVTSATCAEIFDQPKLFEQHPEFISYAYSCSAEPTEAPEHTLGASLERALRIDGEGSLGSHLTNDAERLVALVEEEAQRRREQAITLNNQALAKWREAR